MHVAFGAVPVLLTAPLAGQGTLLMPAHEVATEHVLFQFVDQPDSATIAIATLETLRRYERVAEVLGVRPERRIIVVFGGNAERPDGEWEYPRVDAYGRVLLFQFTPEFRNHFNALAHELVHAFRYPRGRDADWFLEEGLAEFVALRADSSREGFPWFGYPVPLVAGQWLASGDGIPLAVIRARHRELNLACSAQTYPLRSSFFDWLGRAHGDDAVLAAARAALDGPVRYERFFGSPFDRLVEDWRQAMLDAYHAMPDVEAVARRYRTQSPMQYQSVCAAGVDY